MASSRTKFYAVSDLVKTNIMRYIQYWLFSEDSQRINGAKVHISTEDAYQYIDQQLNLIEINGYDYFDKQNLKKITRKDWKKFASIELLIVLDAIYHENHANFVPDYPNTDDPSYELNDREDTRDVITPKIAIIRLQCAKRIWVDWDNARHFGPRVGAILIASTEEGAEKVLVVKHIRNTSSKCLNIGFPKGKPNTGETIRQGALRECVEETNPFDPYHIISTAIENGKIIRKYPYIGYGNTRHTRVHHYVINTIDAETISFRPDKNEISDAQWHSVYSLPCGKNCKKCWKSTFYYDDSIPVNYHMVTLVDINQKNSAVVDIMAFIDAKNNSYNARQKYCNFHRDCRRNVK